MRTLFNITVDEFDQILDHQGGVCAISKQPSNNFNVDHDHKDGKIRGLLDWRMNKAIAGFKDNPELLRNAADYLENPPAVEALGEEVYGVIGTINKKAKNRRYGPDGSKTPQPRKGNNSST